MPWEIDKRGLVTKGGIPYEEKDWIYIPEKIFGSPKGNYAVYCYGTVEERTMATYTNFMLLKNPVRTRMLVKGDQAGIWYSDINRGNMAWSASERYLWLPVWLRHSEVKRSFGGALIIDLKLRKYSFIPLEGSDNYRVKFKIGRYLEMEHEQPIPERNYYSIVPKSTCRLDRFQWFPLDQFILIGKLFSQGRFGHFLGNVRDEWNLLIKGSYVPWPYSEMDYYRNKFAASGRKSAKNSRAKASS